MSVLVVADNLAKLSSICSTLQPHHQVTPHLLGDAELGDVMPQILVVRADLRAIENIAPLRKTLDPLRRAKKRVFIVEQPTHAAVSQAYALGATEVLAGSLNSSHLLACLSSREGHPSSAGSDGRSDAVSAAATAMASMFTAVADGIPLDMAGLKQMGAGIADRIDEDGLSDWLATVRRHHEGTYQHCLLVTGIAVDFGLSLGMRRTDIERLHSAALFHDIGKARIPLAILDKPGRLDDGERALIETHPVAGYEVLAAQNEVSGEILHAVRHHHEYLDGSGYPDGLCGESISDIVRILTISDIFSALIEHRKYKPTMSRADAYDILCGMHGKLEKALVNAFKPVALDR